MNLGALLAASSAVLISLVVIAVFVGLTLILTARADDR
jgi:hypothetical protein